MPRTTRTRTPMVKNWCFTHNNPEASDYELYSGLVEQGTCSYLVFQKEEGEAGTPHLQGYMCLTKKMRLLTLKAKLHPAQPHLEPAGGNAVQNRKYCTKEEGRLDGPWEYGALPKVGKAALMKSLADGVEAGMSARQLTQAYPTLLGHSKAIKYAQFLVSQEKGLKWRVLDVNVSVGGTGTGKTREAVGGDYLNSYIWSKMNAAGTTNWFCGYAGQDHLIIDEIQPGDFSITQMLRILDGHPLLMQVKGDAVYATYTRVTLTSNYPVAAWFPKAGSESLAALDRRINNTWFYANGPSGATRTDQNGVQVSVVFSDPVIGGSGSGSGGNTERSSTFAPSPSGVAAARTLATLNSPYPLVRSDASIWTGDLAGHAGVGGLGTTPTAWPTVVPLPGGGGGGGSPPTLPPGQPGSVEIDLTLLDSYEYELDDYSIPLESDSEQMSAHTSGESTVGYMSPFEGLSISDSDE